MKYFFAILAITALGFTFIPSLLVFYGAIEIQQYKMFMAIGAVTWFIAAPIWFRISRNEKETTKVA